MDRAVRPVWVKVYPEVKSIEVCRELGLEPERIFAFHGFGTKEILKTIIDMTRSFLDFAKESGILAGLMSK